MKAWTDSLTAVSARLAISSSFWRNASNPISKWFSILYIYSRHSDIRDGRILTSAETAGDVIFSLLLRGAGEYFCRRAKFNQFAQIEESGKIRGPRRLLHVVGNDD